MFENTYTEQQSQAGKTETTYNVQHVPDHLLYNSVSEKSSSVIWTMYAILLSACGILVAWDQFYHYLDGLSVDNDYISQLWVSHVTSGLQFLTKALLVFATTAAFFQVLWLSFRNETLSISKVNDNFSALTNPFKLGKLGSFTRTKRAATIAVVAWCLPFASILTPATLSIVGQQASSQTVALAPYPDLSLNQGMFSIKGDNNGVESYYRGNSQPSRPVYASLINDEVSTFDSPCGANCSYTVTFDAPAWDCSQLTSTTAAKLGPLAYNAPDFYIGEGNWYQYSSQRVVNATIRPELQALYKDYYGNDTLTGYYLRMDVPIKGGLNSTQKSPYGTSSYVSGSPPMAGIVCNFVQASYETNVIFENNVQKTEVKVSKGPNFLAEPLREVWRADELTFANSQPVFSSYNMTRLNSLSILSAINNFFEGAITYSRGGIAVNRTSVALTRLYIPDDTMDRAHIDSTTITDDLEQLVHNVMLSFMNPANIKQPAYKSVTATQVNYTAVYSYHRKTFWEIYVVAVVATFLCCSTGWYAYKRNGRAHDGSFIDILRMTQHASLVPVFEPPMFEKAIKSTRMVLKEKFQVP